MIDEQQKEPFLSTLGTQDNLDQIERSRKALEVESHLERQRSLPDAAAALELTEFERSVLQKLGDIKNLLERLLKQ